MHSDHPSKKMYLNTIPHMNICEDKEGNISELEGILERLWEHFRELLEYKD